MVNSQHKASLLRETPIPFVRLLPLGFLLLHTILVPLRILSQSRRLGAHRKQEEHSGDEKKRKRKEGKSWVNESGG